MGTAKSKKSPIYANEEEMLRLRSVIAAQKWDIAGLVEQRDALLQTVAAREETIAHLESRLTARKAERGRMARTITTLRESGRRAGAGLDLAATALGLLPALLDGAGAMPVALAAWLLETLGMIDAAFYRRHCPLSLGDVDPAAHYLAQGEAAGIAPNVLFDPRFYRSQLPPETALPAGLLGHYLLEGWRQGLDPHPLFSGAFYARRYGSEGAGKINPLLHFLRLGAAAGHAPHPLFDPGFYARQRGEGAGHDAAALVEHFLATGWREGLVPSPLFDAVFYIRRNRAALEAGVNPLLHYLLVGEAEGRMPNPGFDPAYYRERLPAGEAPRGSAIAHFVASGAARGLAPSPLFDPAFYVHANPDVRLGDANPLAHYLEFGAREGRDFHPLIDRDYLRHQIEAVAPGEGDYLRLLAEDPRCRALSPTRLFDPAFYAAHVPAAREAPCGLFEHFLRAVARADVSPHPLFSTAFYGAQVEWRARSRDPLSDYLQFGAAEGLLPHPLFDGKIYLERYPDVARDGANPLLHYLEHGGRGTERRIPHALFDPVYFLEKLGRVPQAPHLQEFLTLPLEELADPFPLFDCQYYLRQVPALFESGINPLLHYLLSPPGQGANPHPLFDEAFYLAQKPELARGSKPLLLHYLQTGYKELLSPHPCFDSRYYVEERSPDMVKRGQIPLLHYVMDGSAPIYDPVPWFDGVSYNILHQEADPKAPNPLVDFLARHPDFRPPAPARAPAGAEKPLAAKSRAKFSEADLRAAVAALSNGKGANGKGVPGRATVADVLEGGAMARFIASHDVHIEGTLPAGRKAPRGVALYAIYSASGGLSASHRAILRDLRASGHAIILINSTLAEGRAFLAAARPFADIIVLRANGGRDFASWMAAVGLFYGEISGAEHWLFLNDSLLGPVCDTAPLWRAFRASGAEIWALSDSLQEDHHLQSSFFILRRAAFQSAAFLRYLSAYGFPEERIEIVRQGEIGFSAALKNSTLKLGVMVPHHKLVAAWLAEAPARQAWLDALAEGEAPGMAAALIPARARAAFVRFAEGWLRETEAAVRRGEARNPQHHFWDTLISRFSYPFVKRDLLTLNPLHVPTVPRLFEIIGAAFRPDLMETLATLVGPAPAGGTVLRLSRESLSALPANPAPKAPARRRERAYA
jgi:hypothetical protein